MKNQKKGKKSPAKNSATPVAPKEYEAAQREIQNEKLKYPVREDGDLPEWSEKDLVQDSTDDPQKISTSPSRAGRRHNVYAQGNRFSPGNRGRV